RFDRFAVNQHASGNRRLSRGVGRLAAATIASCARCEHGAQTGKINRKAALTPEKAIIGTAHRMSTSNEKGSNFEPGPAVPPPVPCQTQPEKPEKLRTSPAGCRHRACTGNAG